MSLDTSDHPATHGQHNRAFRTTLWKSKAGVVLCGFLIVGAFFLLTEHWAHVLGVLPYLLILACPLMHIFMHGGHGGHDGQTPTKRKPDSGADA